MTIELEVPESTKAQISIVSITGKLVQIVPVDLSKGKHQVEIELDHIANGIYFAKIETSNETRLLKFIKQE
ncbi:MAG: hypothetical protein ACI8P3_003418 [Saprospiraceae bacterium]|jgi:hypothetical protein